MRQFFATLTVLAAALGFVSPAFAYCDGNGYPSTANYQTNGIGDGYSAWPGVSIGSAGVVNGSADPCHPGGAFSGGSGLEGKSDGDFQLVQYGSQQQQDQGKTDSIYGMSASVQRWHTNTGGHTGAIMTMGGSICGTGVLCVYDRNNNNTVLWSYDSGDRNTGTWLELYGTSMGSALYIRDGADNHIVATVGSYGSY